MYEEALTRDATFGGRILTKTERIGRTPTTHTYQYYDNTTTSYLKLKSDNGTTYTYDADSNRTDLCPSIPYDAQDRSGSGCGVTYSTDGRITNDGVNGFSYDAFGNLISSGAITYTVDAENRIVKKAGGTNPYQFLYARGQYPVAQLDASGAVVSTFYYATGRNVPDAILKGGVTYKLVTDHLGSVRLVINASSGAVAQQINYDAWGTATVVSGAGFQPFGFAGGIYDGDTKLVRFGARDYNPRLGRWMTKDASRFGGGLNF